MFTPRESQIAALVREGMQNKEIAYELKTTEGVIKQYLYRMFRKVGVSNRTQLAFKAEQ